MNLHRPLKSFFFTTHCLLLMMLFSTSITAQTGCINEQYTSGTLTENDFGQSFTIPSSGCGTLTAPTIQRKNGIANYLGSLSATFELFVGQTVSGTAQYTQTGITISSGVGDKTITLSGGSGSLTVSPNTQYTWYLTLDQWANWQIGDNSSGEVYSGGQSYVFGSFLSNFDMDMYIDATAGLLPVELTAFDATLQETAVHLTWATASEENNEGFEVQRSADSDPDSYREWEVMDFVIGNGTILEAQAYTFIDEAPLFGTNYYRLKQIDFDNQFEYSDIINLTIEQFGNKTIEIFPNPVQNELNIVNGEGQATIYNMLGQPVKQFTINDETSSIDVADLPKGQYILHIQPQEIGETIVTKRFVK